MKLDQVRTELLAEHAQLRNHLAEVRRLARAIEKGEKVAESESRLRRAINDVYDLLVAHSAREKEVLEPIVRHIDAWGKERAGLLEREHAAEHEALFLVIEEAKRMTGPRKLATVSKTMARELAEHMDEEEKYLLHPEVLTDEIIKTVQLTD